MITQAVRDAFQDVFGNPQAFADILNASLYKEARIHPEMVQECNEALYAIVDEQIHFSERLAVIKVVNDGFHETVCVIEFFEGSDKIIIWTHPNDFIH